MSSPSSGGGGRGRKRSAPQMDDGASEAPGNNYRGDPRPPERFVSSVPLPGRYERCLPPPVEDEDPSDDTTYGISFQTRLSGPRPSERVVSRIPLPRYLVMPSPDEDLEPYLPGRVDEEEDQSYAFVRERARVPASSKAILQGLQEVRAGDAGTPAECAVCLQDFADDDKLRAMPCSHVFHENCLFEWIRRKRNGVCPLCRYTLPARQPDDDEECWRPRRRPAPEELARYRNHVI